MDTCRVCGVTWGISHNCTTANYPTCTHGNDLRFRCEDCEGWTDMGDDPDD